MDELYAICDVPLKGKGLIATYEIPKGTRILAESPLFKLPHQGPSLEILHRLILNELDKLTEAQRKSFYSLHGETEVGIVLTNTLPLGPDPKDGAVFIKSSRINHSCKPNAHNVWNSDLDKITIHAIEDIDQGEEITISYLGALLPYDERQKRLEADFGFECCCRLCRIHPGENDLDDKRVKEINDLTANLVNISSFSISPSRCLHQLYKAISKLEVGSIAYPIIPRLYLNAMEGTLLHSDLARAQVFVQRAIAKCIICEGHDGPTVKRLKTLAENPTQYEFYGLTQRYKSAIEDISETNDVSFENWLWMSPHGFPLFSDSDGLPTEIELASIPPRLMTETEDDFRTPCKHWAFLGEIIHVEVLWRVRLIVKDKTGHQLPVAFYTETHGQEIGASMLRVGFTVVILYAKQHGFMDGTVGIRHEDPGQLRILPTSLDNFLRLNDRVQSYSSTKNQGNICHGCDKKSASLKCSKCGFFWYCNQDCQTRGWDEKGHKADCKLLRKENMKGLFLVKWNEFEKQISFPLTV
ncbi:set domain [Fusarium longipes]|uniref:Set domain n=1 Tax=Fusarium longipes TaxID=694270 RepID=A0A395TAZ6_9HYPO|nr:set domain [Fusarium longipes]